MHYLARALPAGDAQRFVLTDETDDLRWRRLGIVPITFPRSDYRTLYAGIGELAKYTSRGILDWQHDIREIAKSDPPTGDYEVETLADAFTDPARTRFFTTSARDPAWIDWVDRHEHLINLFRGRAELTEAERELANWLAKGFAWGHPDEVWRVIGRHRMHVHPEFWQALAYAVGFGAVVGRSSNVHVRWRQHFAKQASGRSTSHPATAGAERRWVGRPAYARPVPGNPGRCGAQAPDHGANSGRESGSFRSSWRSSARARE